MADAVSAAIRRVVEQREVFVVFQPVVDLSTATVAGYRSAIRPFLEQHVQAGRLELGDLAAAGRERNRAAHNSIRAERGLRDHKPSRMTSTSSLNKKARCSSRALR